jgi:flavin reductase (DIM6/NTAB) family NADH-FMN oxidoreductase RutF
MAVPADDSGPASGPKGSTVDAFIDTSDYPLYVVTCSADGEDSGCLVGFVTQCSIEPVNFIVCISKVNHTFGVAIRSRGLAIHRLGSDQRDVATLFGGESGDWVDKFSRIHWHRGVTGAPILAECTAFVEGPITHRTSGGDHEAFVVSANGGGVGTHKGQFMLSQSLSIDAGHSA